MNVTITGIQHELENELKSTQKILAALPQDKADWKPHEKSMSIASLANHIVELQTWFDNALTKDTFDFFTDYKKLDINSFTDLSEYLEQKVQENLEFLKTTDENFWLQLYTIKAGDHVIFKAPRLAVMRSFLYNHLIHHRGQLSVYLRLLDLPVPGMYGPSADER